jgi:hypothetical protein
MIHPLDCVNPAYRLLQESLRKISRDPGTNSGAAASRNGGRHLVRDGQISYGFCADRSALASRHTFSPTGAAYGA